MLCNSDPGHHSHYTRSPQRDHVPRNLKDWAIWRVLRRKHQLLNVLSECASRSCDVGTEDSVSYAVLRPTNSRRSAIVTAMFIGRFTSTVARHFGFLLSVSDGITA